MLYAGGCAELKALAEQVGAPVATTLAGKSAFPETHPLSVGTAAAASTAASVHFLERADVLFAVGTSLTRHLMTRTLPSTVRIIHLTLDHADLYKPFSYGALFE